MDTDKNLQLCLIEFGTPEYDESVRLRYDVLRKPLNMFFEEKDLALEYDAIHLAAYDTSSVMVACLILKPLNDSCCKMRQVAVAESVQGKGIGSELVHYSEAIAKYKGFEVMELNARATAVDFYTKLGYKTEGKPFEEVGIPHRYMKKMLS